MAGVSKFDMPPSLPLIELPLFFFVFVFFFFFFLFFFSFLDYIPSFFPFCKFRIGLSF